jgi:RNA polymerase sigma factor (TIGR02999 family)
MTHADSARITRLLVQMRDGAPHAAEELLPIVYDELRKLARARMARERPGQTLQATALVHEAYLRLAADSDPGWANRAHFFAAAAECMRRILVDRARRKARIRHGGDQVRVTLDESPAGDTPDEADVLAVDQALRRLEQLDGQMAQVVVLRYFGGLEVEECAAALGLSPRTVNRLWTAARAWLQRELTRA